MSALLCQMISVIIFYSISEISITDSCIHFNGENRLGESHTAAIQAILFKCRIYLLCFLLYNIFAYLFLFHLSQIETNFSSKSKHNWSVRWGDAGHWKWPLENNQVYFMSLGQLARLRGHMRVAKMDLHWFGPQTSTLGNKGEFYFIFQHQT